MQASRSLFQTSIRLQARAATVPTPGRHSGISKSRPFLNLWRGEQVEQQQQQQQQRRQGESESESESESGKMAPATNFFDFTVKDKKGNPYPLAQHRSQVILVVNTASKCGFTPQLTSLQSLQESLHKRYPGPDADAFTVLAFPCNQFNNQDPGSDDQIQSFCQLNHGVAFPVLAKADVNGDAADPLWTWLKAERPGLLGLKRIKWNFEKFLVAADGSVVGRWASTTKPEALEKVIVEEIEKARAAKVAGTDGTVGKQKEGGQL